MSVKVPYLNKLAPKDVILISLLIIVTFSILNVGLSSVWLQVVICCLVAIVVDIGLNFLKKTRFFFPKAGLITGLIVSLVLPLGVNPLVVALAAFTAILSKQLLRIGRNHIFNPASFGLVLVAVLFKIPFGWWADGLPWLVIILGVVTILKARKELQVLGFIVTYILIQYLFLRSSVTSDLETLKTALNANSWFFTFFMLSEPMTSLLPYRLSPVFGFIAASAVINLSFIPITAISNNSILLGLLFANLVAFGYLYLQRREARAL